MRDIPGKVAAFLAAFLLAACQSTASVKTDTGSERGYPVDLPELTCAKYGKPLGREAKLTASRVTKGDPYYIEFRTRFSPAIVSDHMYVVFGRLDAKGRPATRQYIGLFPYFGPVGLTGGLVVPIPAAVKPNILDCDARPTSAYRVSLSEEQYQKLLARVRHVLAHPPMWHMVFYNCNRFAAELGAVAGLKLPENKLLPSHAYLQAFIRANGDAKTATN